MALFYANNLVFIRQPASQAPHIMESQCVLCRRSFYAPTADALDVAERSHRCTEVLRSISPKDDSPTAR